MADRNRAPFRPGDIPPSPGVYVYRDRFGKVIYVGKAANLRRRMSQYFQPSREKSADPRLRSLLKSIFHWEYHVVKDADEALILESRLIKDYAPHYNVLMRDDKRYFLLKINLNERFPRLTLARIKKDDNALYYGPYPHGTALRAALEYLNRHFGLRVCRSLDPGEEDRRHCQARVVKDCSEPCIGKEDEGGYAARIEAVKRVFAGDIKGVREELTARMTAAAEARRYEVAAKWRDVIAVLEAAFSGRHRSFTHTGLPSSSGGVEAVEDLRSALGLDRAPAVVEGFDISNIGGTLAVAGMVCFVNGHQCRERYRRYRIRSVDHSDDFAMMAEALERCYRRRLDEGRDLPDLIMVDGGKGQLSSALSALAALGLETIPVVGLAKKQEEIFLPGKSLPLVLERGRPALMLLQALRDEAHRFAVSYHRNLRTKRLRESVLDEMPGIGEARKKALLKAFGSLRELRKADAEEIAAKVSGIGTAFAGKLCEFLKKSTDEAMGKARNASGRSGHMAE